MATKTGKMVVDKRTGKMVEEFREDQMKVALKDSNCDKAEEHAFQNVLRSDFTVKKINQLFNCNAALLKDPFGNVIWPKDWIARVLPPTPTEKWFYIIHERLEPAPQDDNRNPFYAGSTIVVLSGVPIECKAIDLKTWLLYGISKDYEPLEKLRKDIDMAVRKQTLLKQRQKMIPEVSVGEKPQNEDQVKHELRDMISNHTARLNSELMILRKRYRRVERLLLTEPIELSPWSKENNSSTQSSDIENDRVETRTWIAQFTSCRAAELTDVAMKKCDWNYVCLLRTRPSPIAFIEDDDNDKDSYSAKDLDKEVNMRAVRLRRVKHGEGMDIQLVNQEFTSPCDEDFHISAIGSAYAGMWEMGKKHGLGKEYTNEGIYTGYFVDNTRKGEGRFVYGDGSIASGSYQRPSRTYEYHSDAVIESSLLNGDAYRDGVLHGERERIEFPDGAVYEGEMVDGTVTGLGKYRSSVGVVDEGTFVNGLLHGKHCRRTYPSGMIQEGEFENGELHGRGKLIEKNGDVYDGFFDVGVKQGRGTCTLNDKKAKYVGFWHDNAMNGRGDFYYKAPESTNDNSWDYWYEGAFLHGSTKARHRHIDLHHRSRSHLPFTTNGKSVTRLDYLTSKLPIQLSTKAKRSKKNNYRRSMRQLDYLQQQSHANLSLYFELLDTFFQDWTTAQQEMEEDEALDKEREQVHHKRRTEDESQNREKRWKEHHYLQRRARDIHRFEEYINHITLTEHTQLERAVEREAGNLE